MIYIIWHDWANYHEAIFIDRKKAADYIRRVRQYAPNHLTRLTVVHENGHERNRFRK